MRRAEWYEGILVVVIALLIVGSILLSGWRNPYAPRTLRQDLDDLEARVKKLEGR